MHVTALMAEYLPTLHVMQADVPVVTALYVPAAHPTQTAEVLAPPVAKLSYVPTAHAVQAEVPVVKSLYFPTPQDTQAASEEEPVAELNFPALHQIQPEEDEAPRNGL